MKKTLLFIINLAIPLFLFAQTATGNTTIVNSPNGRIQIRFSVTEEFATATSSFMEGTPVYEVWVGNKPFLLPSRMGFELLGSVELKHYLKIDKIATGESRKTWKPAYGEKDEYPDNYNQMDITLKESIFPNRSFRIVFRAYDEGIAFRYEIPKQNGLENIIIDKELTEFSFPKNTSVWESYGHEGKYYKVYPYEIKEKCELPLTCFTPNGIYGAIAEAGNNHYPRAYVEAPYRKQNTIRINLRGEAKSKGDMNTAWRSITISDTPGGLIEQNYLILNLNETSKIEDTSWIKPGTAIRDINISTPSAKKYIDFCEYMGINYLLFDWGWYGAPNDHKSDPSYVNVVNTSTDKSIPDHPGLEMPDVVRYAQSKNIGLFLYVNRQGIERYADKIFPVYEKWGIKGIKPGFVSVGNQEWQEWLEDMVAKAAKYHLMVNIHDAYRPNGFSRTYPNLVTQEGIHGNEQNPNSDHNTMLPFTRFTIGAGDYTPGYCRNDLQDTRAHRLALPIVFYSPVQFLFWREPLTDCLYKPELELWRNIPTVWNDTKVLSGSIGEYIVMARRSGKTWYVGGITNANSRSLTVDCSFLLPNKRYEATTYTDEPGSVKITKQKISSKGQLKFDVLPSGGFSIKIQEI